VLFKRISSGRSFRISPDSASEHRVPDGAIFTLGGTLMALFSFAGSAPGTGESTAEPALIRLILFPEFRK